MSEDNVKVTYLRGEVKLEPVRYYITHRSVPRRWKWLGRRNEFYIETRYSRLGPFETMREIFEMTRYGGISFEPGLYDYGDVR